MKRPGVRIPLPPPISPVAKFKHLPGDENAVRLGGARQRRVLIAPLRDHLPEAQRSKPIPLPPHIRSPANEKSETRNTKFETILNSNFRKLFRIFDFGFEFSALQSSPGAQSTSNGAGFAFDCCTVMTSATEPIIKAAARMDRALKVSPAKMAPRITATIGFTYA